ncbi:type VI secretion system baseplate subunit TssG [Piscinibacter sp. HJYY11]|uniref:type VI secretion system baseplate subunit TssG n=1 Tax=Piscinibacter sp. HJYY11 TaxID=2801333 RepID=UPI00192028E1|nr:type VI secretion system baseplate subunit TssG [Piscinibacter sp. HJYY11]MBL0730553.1 type VI secretion system baseplate subunit TssG [Piscinibacter sp. HJYY11]
MPASKRFDGPGLIDQLLADPHRFEFFQAVRLLELALSDGPAPASELVPRQLKFRNSVSLSFPVNEIEALSVQRTEAHEGQAQDQPIERVEMTPAFMGLLGMTGALPFSYTEQIAQRELYQRDFAARSFLDLFSNRAVALFYAAWKKSRLHLQYESDRRNRFAPMVLALAGLGQSSLRDRLGPEQGGVGDESLAFFAGALQHRALSASQLAQLLARYLHVPVRIEQFCGRWYPLPAGARTELGIGNGVLGRNALSGERVWQRDLRVKLILGPLTHELFRRFLPGAPGATALRELTTLLSGVSLEYEVNLTLRADAVDGSTLSSRRSPLAGRLGWDTYVQTRPQHVDRCDVRYEIHAAQA